MIKRTVHTEFLIDEEKAEAIAKRLTADFSGKKGVFKSYNAPGQALPVKIKEGSREHALFLTYVVSIDCMTDSTQLWKKSRGAYVLFPENFTPEKILKTNPPSLESFVRNLGARSPEIAAKTWVEISKLLKNKYQSDPRNITKEPARIQDIKKQLRLFPYLKGDKLSNFYIRTMGESGLLKIKNADQLNIPVDKQVARFTIYCGALKLQSKHFVGCVQTEPLKDLIEETWSTAVKNLQMAPWKLYEPMSVMAARQCEARKCRACSVSDACECVKGVVFRDNVVFWRRTLKQPAAQPAITAEPKSTEHPSKKPAKPKAKRV